VLKKLYDLFSVVRFYDFVFRVVKRVASPFENIIITFLNWRLRPERPFRPMRGSTLQMVIRPDERAYVGWPVIKYVFKLFIRENTENNVDNKQIVSDGTNFLRFMVAIPIMVAGFYVVVWYAAGLNPDIFRFIFPKGMPDISTAFKSTIGANFNLGIMLIALAVFLLLVWLFGLVFTYWRYEWERRHNVFAFFLEGLLHLEAEFIGRAVTPFYSGNNKKVDTLTPSNEIMEIELVTDVEDLIGGEKTPLAQDKWSQYLSKKYQIQSFRIASRSGAPDILRHISLAPSTLDCINQVVESGNTFRDTLKSFKQKEQEVLAGGAGSGSFDAKASSREISKVWEDFNRLYPQPIKEYKNAFKMEDPGLWDRHLGTLAGNDRDDEVLGSTVDFSNLEIYGSEIEQEEPTEEIGDSKDKFADRKVERKNMSQRFFTTTKGSPIKQDSENGESENQVLSESESDQDQNGDKNFWETFS